MKSMRILSLVVLAGIVTAWSGIAAIAAQQPMNFAHPAFERVWSRTDALVAEARTARTWFWGPQPNSPGLLETFTDAANGSGVRLVQYFDKSRMELNNPEGDPNDPFYVTNGLLTVELIGGCIQTSSTQPCGETRYPAEIAMSGDSGDQLAPTYAAFRNVANSSAGDHPAPDRSGQFVTATIDRAGNVGEDPSKASLPLTRLAYFEPITQHNIPEAFWNFLNQSGLVREQGNVVTGPLISPWFYASGLPISEAYWARATIAGEVKDVMIQAYERRVLTYVPTNEPNWQVEMGNIGQHYYNWRYTFAGQPGSGPVFTPPAGGGTPTFAPTQLPGETSTAVPTTTAGTTMTPGTGTPEASPTGTPEEEPTETTTPGASGTTTPEATPTVGLAETQTPTPAATSTVGNPVITPTTDPVIPPSPSPVPQ